MPIIVYSLKLGQGGSALATFLRRLEMDLITVKDRKGRHYLITRYAAKLGGVAQGDSVAKATLDMILKVDSAHRLQVIEDRGRKNGTV